MEHLDEARAVLDATTAPPRPIRPTRITLGEHLRTVAAVDSDSVELRIIDGALMISLWDDDSELAATVLLRRNGIVALVDALDDAIDALDAQGETGG